MNPGPLAMATARERASDLARTAAARKAVVRSRTRTLKGSDPYLMAAPTLRPAQPGCS